MSYLNTLSVFYYGTTITKLNQNLDFSEGGPEITAAIGVGDYTLSEFADAVGTAMTLAGTQTYTAVINRTLRKITISAASTFQLLSLTGTHAGSSPWVLLGYTTVSNKTGTNTYLSQNGTGSEYRPQLLMDNYIQPEDFEVKESAVVNTSTNGVVQTLQFGDGQRMQCNLRGATDLLNIKTSPFFENAAGVQALRDFMKYLITKAKIEFMPDVDTRGTFYKMLLESTGADRNGTRFMINNMDGANRFFQSGVLTFRKVTE